MFGLPHHPITLARVFGAGCLILGAALVRG
jgi:transporter family-2 protein